MNVLLFANNLTLIQRTKDDFERAISMLEQNAKDHTCPYD